MGCYLFPSNASNIEDVAAAIRVQLYGAKLLVTGDINANLAYPEGTPRYEAITENLVAAGLEDMGMHFLPRRKPWLQ